MIYNTFFTFKCYADFDKLGARFIYDSDYSTIVAAKLEPYFVIHSSTWPLNLTEPASIGLNYLLKSYWNDDQKVQVFREGYKNL